VGVNEKERIIIPDENNEEHLFEVLFKFNIDEMNASYICLLPVDQLDSDEAEVYAFRYEEDGNNEENDLKLFPIESDEEWDIVEEMLYTLAEQELDQ